LFKDLELSLRHLARTPGFTGAAVLVLALGIGLNATMFGLCYLMAAAGRPFRDPDALVQLYSRKAEEPDSYRGFSHAAYRQIAARADPFEGVLAHQLAVVGVREGGEARRRFAAIVSASYFDVLGVPLRGRSFTADEERPGSDTPVVVVSHAFWKRAGGDAVTLGRHLRVNERDFTVVGIAPAGFTGTMSVFGPDLFFPLGVFDSLTNDFEGQEARTLARSDTFNLFLVGRLRKGETVESAGPALKLAAEEVRRAWPVEYAGQEFQVAPLPRIGTSTSPSNEEALTTVSIVLLGMTGAVLTIVCLNLASMLLARGQGRRREFAIRLALGGGRARIVRQLLVEGLVLSAAGGALGVLAGALATDALLASLTSRLPIAIAVDLLSLPTLVGGAALFSCFATLLFGLGPALRHSRADVVSDLKLQAGEDASGARRRLRLRHPLVALQVGLSLSLLIAAGLFVRMARETAAVDLGLRAHDAVLAEVDASLSGYDETRGLQAYARIEERLRALPGVRSAAAGATVPFGAVSLGRAARRAGAAPGAPSFRARWNAVGASYFDAVGVPLKRGRPFSDGEAQRQGAPAVAVIDEVLARQLWPGEEALGRELELTSDDSAAPASGPVEVVGIVPVVRDDFFSKSPGGAVYVPLAQGYRSNVHFHVRPADGANVAALRDAVRREIGAVAPGLPLFRVTTLGEHLSRSLEHWGVHLMAGLFTAMGGLATLVSLVGIYGATSYAVSRRTREIGVRMALGATPSRVLAMVLGEGLLVAAAGVGLGLLLGVGLGRALDSVFVEVVAFDPLTFALAAVLVLLACLGAALLPARRATTVDPSVALRAD
jgi:predicted permease